MIRARLFHPRFTKTNRHFVFCWQPVLYDARYKSARDLEPCDYSKNDSIPQSGIDTLYSIASQCALTGGLAVYQARAILDWEYNFVLPFTDSCGGTAGSGNRAELGSSSSNGLNDSLKAKVYPNPTSSLLNVEVQLQPNEVDNLCLYNSLGELIKCETLKSTLTTISTSDLPSGIYYYRIEQSNGSLIQADKVMVVH